MTILKKNLEIPNGEIDFICGKSGKTFLIEAKDYNPWFDDSYIGSYTYNKRIESISEKLEKLSYRIQWVESNPTVIGLSDNPHIHGLILTRFSEPHIRIPPKFQLVTIHELDTVFGESVYHKIYETNLKFRLSEEQIRITEEGLIEKARSGFNEYGLR